METNTHLIDRSAVGIEVSWSFGAGDADAVKLPRAAVSELMTDLGYRVPDAIGSKDESDALKHALRITRKGAGFILRELERPNKDTPIAVGVYRVTGVDGERGDAVECGARVRFESGRAVCLAPEGAAGDPDCLRIGQRTAEIANELADTAYNKDLSNALLDLGGSLNWISRRANKGGVYFILARKDTHESATAERFVKLLHGLRDLSRRTAGSEPFRAEIIEVFPRPLANATIAEAATESFTAEVARLSADLDRMIQGGVMRESTMAARAEECDRVIARAEQYRVWMKEHVDTIGQKLAAIRDRFQAALNKAGDAVQALDDIDKAVASATAPLPVRQARKPASEWHDKEFDLSFFDVEK